MNEPILRFKGFNEEWKKEKLSELSSIHARIGWQNLRTSEFLSKGDYLLITGTDFKNGEINFDSCHYVEKERYDQDKKIQLKNGNILITKDGTLGKVALVRGLNMPATLNAGVFNIVPNNKHINNTYLFHFLRAPFLMKYAENNATGGTIKHLNQSILVEFPIPTTSLEEEQQIGEFFEKLIKLIKLQYNKLNHLKKIKKGYLQKIFPDYKNKSLKIRFKGFSKEWEEKHLKNLGNFTVGISSYNNIIKKNGKYPITANGIKNRGIVGYSDSYLVSAPAITISGRGNIGHTEYREVSFTPAINSLAFKSNKINLRYAYVSIGLIRFFNESGGIPQLTKNKAGNYKIYLPSLKEQKKIGDFFCIIDKQITLQQQKIDNLEKQKKAYLQKMFI